MMMQKPAATKPAREKRMTINAVSSGRIATPIRVLVYGEPGVGKSTFGADAPRPIFLATEEGTSELNVDRFPEPECWADVLEALDTLIRDEHSYQTLVVDTVDWMEPLVWRQVCETAKVDAIEDVGGGYGKGYTAALDLWRVFFARLEQLARMRRMHVILLGHSQVKKFQNPLGEDYDRYQLKLNDKANGILKEWAKAVLFARVETFAAKDAKTKRVRGVTSGNRIVHTVNSAAYDAKNRYDLPETMPLSWADFEAAVRARRPADPEKLRARIAEMLEGQPEELAARVNKAVTAAADDAAKLARIAEHLSAQINTQGD